MPAHLPSNANPPDAHQFHELVLHVCAGLAQVPLLRARFPTLSPQLTSAEWDRLPSTSVADYAHIASATAATRSDERLFTVSPPLDDRRPEFPFAILFSHADRERAADRVARLLEVAGHLLVDELLIVTSDAQHRFAAELTELAIKRGYVPALSLVDAADPEGVTLAAIAARATTLIWLLESRPPARLLETELRTIVTVNAGVRFSLPIRHLDVVQTDAAPYLGLRDGYDSTRALSDHYLLEQVNDCMLVTSRFDALMPLVRLSVPWSRRLSAETAI